MAYKLVTKEQEREILENKIRELEQRHRVTKIELVAAQAVLDAAGDDSEQLDASSREIDILERNLESMDAAIKALHTLAAKEFPNRRARRSAERANAKTPPKGDEKA